MSVENLKTGQPASISFLNNLREKTSRLHKELEALPISKSVVDPEITLPDYKKYLSLMHDVVKNFEQQVYPMLLHEVPDIEERRKASLLWNDLKYAGAAKESDARQLEMKVASVPFAMGMMYVIEGSTLGGRFILKNIQENLGFDENHGASYLSGYGNKTGSCWKKFLNYLTDFEHDTDHEEEIIAGADYAFSLIFKHLSENSILPYED
ncbi:MAG TPA: biliverdin-producing heme oxygenase [Flavobacterium sp.]|nr:biliverdin-producing heme oxygenase [Flavobacterium sp.]